MTKEEKLIAKGISRIHKFKNNEAEFINQYLQPSSDHAASATEISRYLQQFYKGTFNAQRIGTTLTEMEFRNKVLNGYKLYYIETKEGKSIKDATSHNEANGVPF